MAYNKKAESDDYSFLIVPAHTDFTCHRSPGRVTHHSLSPRWNEVVMQSAPSVVANRSQREAYPAFVSSIPITMTWAQIHSLTSSLLSRITLVAALAMPYAFLTKFNINLPYYRLSLLGAVLFFVAYIIYILLIPSLIRTYNGLEDYCRHMQQLSAEEIIDLRSEFGQIVRLIECQRTVDIKGCPHVIARFSSLSELIDIIGAGQSCRYLAIANYCFHDHLYPRLRILETICLLIGFALTQAPMIVSVSSILLGS